MAEKLENGKMIMHNESQIKHVSKSQKSKSMFESLNMILDNLNPPKSTTDAYKKLWPKRD
jgi:hypothetical protein